MRLCKSALRDIGFPVRTAIDTTEEEMAAAIGASGQDLRQADVALFYVAGHADAVRHRRPAHVTAYPEGSNLDSSAPVLKKATVV